MPTFSYTGKAASGMPLKGSIEANSRDHAVRELRKQGIYITDLREPIALPKVGGVDFRDIPGTAGKFQPLLDYFGFTWVSQKALAVYTRKFATMLRAGVDYGATLNLLAEETENRRLAQISREMTAKVGHGLMLSTLFAQHPAVFPKVFVSMVHAGEVAGRLDTIMLELARVYDNEVALRAAIMSRLYYPIGLLIVALLLIGGLLTIVPRMLPPESAEIFGGFFSVSTYLLVLMLYGSLAAVLLWFRTKPGYAFFRGVITYVPYIGVLLKKLSLIRFCRLLAAMYASGVPLLEALDVAEETVAEPYLKTGVQRTAYLVNQGNDLAESLKQSGVFPGRVLSLVRAGEVAGDVESMLNKIADYYELEAEAQGHIVATVGYFVVYGIIAFTVVIFILGAWGNYFGIINGLINEI
ncbi:MAG TPA: type II secretion system F family protein [bacterium]|nr:type II secretion system F family protein [bacterium]